MREHNNRQTHSKYLTNLGANVPDRWARVKESCKAVHMVVILARQSSYPNRSTAVPPSLKRENERSRSRQMVQLYYVQNVDDRRYCNCMSSIKPLTYAGCTDLERSQSWKMTVGLENPDAPGYWEIATWYCVQKDVRRRLVAPASSALRGPKKSQASTVSTERHYCVISSWLQKHEGMTRG